MIRKRFCTTLTLCVLAGLGGCDNGSKQKTPLTGKAAGRNLLLVTLDTTRADHISCYGYAENTSPTIDGLAKRGVLFEQAYAQAPLTLVSHTSMMTGLYPKEHGVRDNAGASLDASHTTMAKLFQSKGYATGAFVASFILDSRFGLAAGFDTYDDDMGKMDIQAQLAERQRPANVVTDRAMAWLEQKKTGPFFCWVHYYDPHEPYRPPEEFRKAHAKAYDGEIAFMDAQLKRLVDWLESNKLFDKTTVVVVGDHGEAFGEHGEKGHAMFLYQMNLHTPLIFIDPDAKAGWRVPALVEITDVFPTVLDLFGMNPPVKLSSRKLGPALAGQSVPDKDVYSESHSLFNSHGYAEQRSLTTPEWKYISSTRPELYDRKADPGELSNLITTKPAVAKELLTHLLDRFESWTAGKPKTVAQTEESRKALESLGYVGGGSKTSTEFLTSGLPDPKDMLPVIQQMQEVNNLLHAKKRDEALPLLEDAARKSPKSISILYTLGMTYLEMEKVDQAVTTMKDALLLDSKFSPLLVGMGDALMKLNRFDEALKHYQASLGVDDTNPIAYYKLAQAFMKTAKTDEAITHLRKAIQIRTDFSEALYDLGFVLVEKGRTQEAIGPYREAARTRPDHAPTRYNLGIALLRSNQLPEAIEQFQEAVRLRPDYGDALVNMGICFGKQKRFDEATRVLQQAAAIPASAAEAHFNLGVTFEKTKDYSAAVAEYGKALQAKPDHAAAGENLVRIHLRDHAIEDAVIVLRKCVEAAPDNLKFANMLAEILSTAQDDALRDGKTALAVIQKACEKTSYRVSGLLATLAAAYAETGDFDKAVEYARKAMDLAKSGGQQKVADEVAPQLEFYLRKQPYRNPKY